VQRAALLVLGLFGVLMMLAAACGGDDVPPTLTRGPATAVPATAVPSTTEPVATTAPADTVTPADTVAAPTGGVSLKISVDGDALAFDTSNFEVSAGSEVVLIFDNVSTINKHNWVLVNSGAKDDVAARGTGAGPGNGWVQPDDPDVIAGTSLLDAGTSGEVRFTAPAAGTYQFVCTFPGHNLGMFGAFIVTP